MVVNAIFMVNSINDVVVRYSVIGIAYNLCQAGFGGTAPLIGTALSLYNFVYVGVFSAICCALSFVAMCLWNKYDTKPKYGFDFNGENMIKAPSTDL